jgi:hypothetical protein
MDANKLEKLREIDYHVPKTCGLCVHSSFGSPSGFWGECLKHSYDHLKHSDSRRHLSIFRGGTCSGFDPNSQALGELNRFAEFVR